MINYKQQFFLSLLLFFINFFFLTQKYKLALKINFMNIVFLSNKFKDIQYEKYSFLTDQGIYTKNVERILKTFEYSIKQ